MFRRAAHAHPWHTSFFSSTQAVVEFFTRDPIEHVKARDRPLFYELRRQELPSNLSLKL